MEFEDALKIFLALCAGIGALKVIISSVKNCIKEQMIGVCGRLDRLEKDDVSLGGDIKAMRLLLTNIEKSVFSKTQIEDMIDKKILECQKECQSKKQ